MDYSAGTTKGETAEGQFINGPKKLGNAEPNYTAAAVVETKGTGANTKFNALAWTPYERGIFTYNNTAYDVKITKADGTVVYGYIGDGTTGGSTLGHVYTDAGMETEYTSATADTVAYKYDNVIIPQDKLPTLVGHMEHITLYATARRIAINYSQIAAFEAKNDYGFDLADSLAEQAVGKLSYDIDTEVIDLIKQVAIDNTTVDETAELTWSKTLPVGVNYTNLMVA